MVYVLTEAANSVTQPQCIMTPLLEYTFLYLQNWRNPLRYHAIILLDFAIVFSSISKDAVHWWHCKLDFLCLSCNIGIVALLRMYYNYVCMHACRYVHVCMHACMPCMFSQWCHFLIIFPNYEPFKHEFEHQTYQVTLWYLNSNCVTTWYYFTLGLHVIYGVVPLFPYICLNTSHYLLWHQVNVYVIQCSEWSMIMNKQFYISFIVYRCTSVVPNLVTSST